MNHLAEYYATFQNDQYLMHYGVLGQKWGQRNYQNKDGSLTPAGREHYGYGAKREYGSAKDVASQIGRGASKVANAVGKGLSTVGKKAAEGIKAKAHEINENRKQNAAYRKEQKAQKKELDREFQKTFSKDTRSMTNEELKTYTERLVAEKRYLDALKDYKKTDSPFGPLIEEGRKKATTLIAEAADKALRKALDDKYDLGLSGTDKNKNKDGNKNKNNEQEDTRSLMQIVKEAQKKGVGNLSDKEYDKYEKARGKLYKEGILEKPDTKEKSNANPPVTKPQSTSGQTTKRSFGLSKEVHNALVQTNVDPETKIYSPRIVSQTSKGRTTALEIIAIHEGTTVQDIKRNKKYSEFQNNYLF